MCIQDCFRYRDTDEVSIIVTEMEGRGSVMSGCKFWIGGVQEFESIISPWGFSCPCCTVLGGRLLRCERWDVPGCHGSPHRRITECRTSPVHNWRLGKDGEFKIKQMSCQLKLHLLPNDLMTTEGHRVKVDGYHLRVMYHTQEYLGCFTHTHTQKRLETYPASPVCCLRLSPPPPRPTKPPIPTCLPVKSKQAHHNPLIGETLRPIESLVTSFLSQWLVSI